jgi:trehalose transport system substrate-binding protein
MRTDAFGAVEEWQRPYFESVLNALEHTQPRPNVTYWLQVEQILSNAFNDIVTNGQEVQPTLQRYQQEIDTLAQGT